MDDVEVHKIKMAVALPWWIQPIVHGGLVACMYTYPYSSTIGVGIVASILWYFCFRFYNQLVAVYNRQSLLNLIESLSGTLLENGGLKESEDE